MVDAGTDVNTVDASGRTALMVAARAPRIEMVRALLQHKADTNLRDLDGNTALILAAVAGDSDVAHTLIEAGAEIEETNNFGFSPIMMAAMNNHEDFLSVIIEAGIELDFVDIAAVGDTRKMFLLLRAGQDVNARNTADLTALMMSARCGYINAVEVLLDWRAEINISNRHGNTALLSALHARRERERFNIVNLLLSCGAKTDVRNERGETPILLAERLGATDEAALLRKY